jgi:hypothetical protein
MPGCCARRRSTGEGRAHRARAELGPRGRGEILVVQSDIRDAQASLLDARVGEEAGAPAPYARRPDAGDLLAGSWKGRGRG